MIAAHRLRRRVSAHRLLPLVPAHRMRPLVPALALALALGPGGLPAGAVAGPSAPERVHEVRPGETLWHIAAATVGDPTLWPALYLANRDRIKDPARVYPGQRLAIPRIDPDERDALRREAATLTRRGGPQAP